MKLFGIDKIGPATIEVDVIGVAIIGGDIIGGFTVFPILTKNMVRN